jgi:hypothetical protein
MAITFETDSALDVRARLAPVSMMARRAGPYVG